MPKTVLILLAFILQTLFACRAEAKPEQLPYLGSSNPLPVGKRTMTFNDPARNNRAIEVDIFYPGAQAGNNVAVAAGQFPVVVFGHGFVMTVDAYTVLGEALAPAGYILVLPKTEGSFSPSHEAFGRDLAFLVRAMRQAGQDSSSVFFSRVRQEAAVMGHSMGGGAAFLAASYDSSITALSGFAPAVTNPSSVTAAGSVGIPALIFAGANDCVTPPAQHQIPMYNALISACKTYVSITGGSHCRFAGNNFNCNFGEGTCTPRPDISAAVQQERTFRLLILWLDYQLKGEAQAGDDFAAAIQSPNGFTVENICQRFEPGLPSALNLALQSPELSLYPNPAKSQSTINLDWDTDCREGELQLFDTQGKGLQTWPRLRGRSYQALLPELSPGLYILLLQERGQILGQVKLYINP